MTTRDKGGSVAREGGHVDFSVHPHGGGERVLHTAEEAVARETRVTGRHNAADLGQVHTVEVYERAVED